jgi:hypothetical protein
LKNPPFTFDRLRANGGSIETIDFYPFVVSRELVERSNHSKHFFNNPLGTQRRVHVPKDRGCEVWKLSRPYAQLLSFRFS